MKLQGKSWSSQRRWCSIDEEELLQKAVEKIVKSLEAKAVILFGSRARGDWKPWSDYDLLIIASFRERYLDRIARVLEIFKDIPLHIEPHPYTLKEAMEMLRRGNPLIVDALEGGKTLYADRDFNKLLELYREMKRRGMRRSEVSIILPESI